MKTKQAFRPTPERIRTDAMQLRLKPGMRDKIDAAAKKAGISIQAFCNQAIEYAMENLEEPSQ